VCLLGRDVRARNHAGTALNEPVTIEFTPTKAGDVAFACRMNMLKGVIVVQ
jgi:plastocyanin domain-containing protein